MLSRTFPTIVLFALLATLASAQNEVQYPYNPDIDSDGTINVVDLLEVLGVFAQEFTPDGIMVDGMDLVDWILYQDALSASPVQIIDTLLGSQYNQDDEPFVRHRLEGSLTIGRSTNVASGIFSTAMGSGTEASGAYSTAFGRNTLASGNFAHAEGFATIASGTWSAHAEGATTVASGMYSHAEGLSTHAAYSHCHAEGNHTYAFGTSGHAEGGWTESRSEYGHTQNYRTSTYQYAPASSAAGYHTRADQAHQFVVGRSNVHNVEGALFVVGNGGLEDEDHMVALADRSDAFRVFESGNAWVSDTLLAAAVKVGGMDLALMVSELADQIASLQASIISGCTDPTACNYNPQASESDGICTYGTDWFLDADGDGLGDGETVLTACAQPDGYIDTPGDNCDNSAALNFADGSNAPCEFTACEPVEFNGHTYDVVAIGYQCWFAENLQTLQFANGDSIPIVIGNDGAPQSPSNWPSLNDQPGVTAYDMNMTNFLFFGGLYNGLAVADERSICPSGWHVPTDAEFAEMEIAIGMNEEEAFQTGWYRGIGDSINQKLRAPAFNNGTNESGFSALAGGYIDGAYQNSIGAEGRFWTSTALGNVGWNREVRSDPDGRVIRHQYSLSYGFSVRCVQD